ncbi:hypothetical protein RRG08_021815 [Elysia crispata]|uniref:Uncharacterized protein n=1 Tax=Elysia crispata TaxID=231223 RepID=A0AAE1DPP6_9GAST|nr:hypothetical protein RRG08_021815 [Elysia crispata]
MEKKGDRVAKSIGACAKKGVLCYLREPPSTDYESGRSPTPFAYTLHICFVLLRSSQSRCRVRKRRVHCSSSTVFTLTR